MNNNFKSTLKILAATIALTSNLAISAETAGKWSVEAGVNKSTPKVNSGDMSAPALPGTKADVGGDTEPIFAINYILSDHLSTTLVLGTPYKHDISGAGAINGVGKIGTAEVLPPVVFLQYHFLEPKSAFRPYAGVGLGYALYQKETGSGKLTAITNTGSPTPTTFKLDAGIAVASQVGAVYGFNEKWFADVGVNKIWLKTTAHFSTGQTLNIKLDPVTVFVAIGYRL